MLPDSVLHKCNKKIGQHSSNNILDAKGVRNKCEMGGFKIVEALEAEKRDNLLLDVGSFNQVNHMEETPRASELGATRG